MQEILTESKALFEVTRGLRRDFHRHPELGFQEVRTARIVADELRSLGLEVSTGIAKTGVVALLEGGRPGPVALLRFDMDALPVTEETGVEYASLTPGIMHACGHDGHTAIGLTVARLLRDRQQEIAGKVKFVFQPAEEGLGGAEAMVDEGVLEDPRPDACLALHLWNNKPLGWASFTPGPVMAASDIFTIRINGKGGHGATPELTAEPILAGSQIALAIQGIVARNISPHESAVVSVTAFNSGNTFNVIPPVAELLGTIRTFNPVTRGIVLERLQRIVGDIASASNCSADVEIAETTPAVVNDTQITARAREAASKLGLDLKVQTDYRTMISEDMAFMMQNVPGCYFLVGSANAEKGLDAGHHHPRFDFDESVLPTAAALMAQAAMSLLS